MILSIDSSISTFKSLHFNAGLNILLADTHDESSNGRTRNSAGKSSFVQIVDFLLGANCPPKSVFRSEALEAESFNGILQIAGHEIHIQRTGSDAGKIFLLSKPELVEAEIEIDKITQCPFLKLSEWKRYLGHYYFGLPSQPKGTDFSIKSAPTYRSMISYFLRLDHDGGFGNPERSSKDQQRSSYQACLSYLFGLEWRIAQEFQSLRDKEKTLETLKKAANGGVLGERVGTVAKLRPLRAEAEQRVLAKRKQIDEYEVLESYKEISDEAATRQRELQTCSRQLVSLKETLQYLTIALEEERPFQSIDIRGMYDAIGIELPEMALKRFEEVSAFQTSVVQNRQIHLQSEIDETKRQIEVSDAELIEAGAARKELLASLEGKGAFEDLKAIQKELAQLEVDYASLEDRFKAAELLEGDKAELKVDRLELQRRIQADHATRSTQLDRVTLRIRRLIDELYGDREGGFEISATDNGPEFGIHIAGDRGTGIRSMEIFCLDIAIYEAVRARYASPGFLIHDSHLFDGVDARQIRTAIMLGSDSVGDGAQYIVTLNSDIFDSLSFPDDFDIDDAVLPVRLSDDGEGGGLFGFRFD